MNNSNNFRWTLFVASCLIAIGHMSMALAMDLPAITLADKPVRIIRGVTVFKAVVGVPVQKDDIVETGASGAQIEVSKELMFALAPETKIYLLNTQFSESNHVEIVLINGWLKVFDKRSGASGRVLITTPSIRVSLEAGFSIVHVSAGKTEMFAEEGLQTVAEFNEAGKLGAEMKIGREQYASRLVGQSLKIIPRPPKEFIAEMPIIFRDPVVAAPDRLKGIKMQAVKERELDYPDIEHWLKSNIAARKSFVNRFRPRLKDADFRKQLDAQLGQTVDWKPILHPPPPPKPPEEVPAKD
ncbi:MAG: hypothetical protein V4447_10045 [Pseudomonadota bacterium]